MKLPRLKTILLAPLVLFIVVYVSGAIFYAMRDTAPLESLQALPSNSLTIAIFGASGTAGDGILKAAIEADEVERIFVVTRRDTPRIMQGVAAGKVTKITHMNYLEYSAILDQIANVDAVYWAIGISSLGADEETYGRIHVDFPAQFVSQWNSVATKTDRSFHFISSSDISEDSSTMWVREKIRAEKTLFGLANGANLRVVAYRPDFIGATREQANLGNSLLYWFFKPVGAAVRAHQIGQTMVAATLNKSDFPNGAKLSTNKIIQYSQAYERR